MQPASSPGKNRDAPYRLARTRRDLLVLLAHRPQGGGQALLDHPDQFKVLRLEGTPAVMATPRSPAAPAAIDSASPLRARNVTQSGAE